MRVGLGRDGGGGWCGMEVTLLMLLLLSVRGVYAGGGRSGRFPPSSGVVWDCGCGDEAVLLCELVLLLLVLLPVVLDVPGLELVFPALALALFVVVVVVTAGGGAATTTWGLYPTLVFPTPLVLIQPFSSTLGVSESDEWWYRLENLSSPPRSWRRLLSLCSRRFLCRRMRQ